LFYVNENHRNYQVIFVNYHLAYLAIHINIYSIIYVCIHYRECDVYFVHGRNTLVYITIV
jgi:hypothetical protein